MSHYVLVQKPRRKSYYVICEDVDQCLVVVDKEKAITPVGTRITMLRETGTNILEPLSLWRVEKRGEARRYQINPAVPGTVKSVFNALSSLGAQEPEHFAGAVWSIAYRGSAADAKELLLADGWRMFGRDTGQLSAGQAFAMRKGKRGSPELQVVERYKNVRVTVDLKP